jgi:hypothetical protein
MSLSVLKPAFVWGLLLSLPLYWWERDRSPKDRKQSGQFNASVDDGLFPTILAECIVFCAVLFVSAKKKAPSENTRPYPPSALVKTVPSI